MYFHKIWDVSCTQCCVGAVVDYVPLESSSWTDIMYFVLGAEDQPLVW